MQSNKKNISLLFLLFLVAMPLFFSVYTIIAKIIIEHRMEEKLEQENLQVLILDASSIIWLRKNKEILVNGEPFDVETITRNGNKVIVSGLYDQQEKKLKQQLQAFDQSNDKSASANNSLLLLLFTTYYQAINRMILHTAFIIQKKQIWRKQQDKTCKSYHEIVTPPPRLI